MGKGPGQWLKGAGWLGSGVFAGVLLILLLGGAVGKSQLGVVYAGSLPTPVTPTSLPLAAAASSVLSDTYPLTLTTISLFSGDVCAVWGRTVGSVASLSVPAGPALISFSTYSDYTLQPHHEYKYTFANRVGDTLPTLTLDGQALPVLYRGELRIEYMPVPVSKRYSYAAYGLVTLTPGEYELVGEWRFLAGLKDGPRRCRLTVTTGETGLP